LVILSCIDAPTRSGNAGSPEAPGTSGFALDLAADSPHDAQSEPVSERSDEDSNMRTTTRGLRFLSAGVAAVLGLCVAWADDPPKPAEEGTLIVLDAAGKEQKLKSWKFSAGTRRLTWLASEKGKDDPSKTAPEALEFVHAEEIMYLPAVTTLIPLERMRAVDFDEEKETMTVRVATGTKADADEVLTGATKYKRLNKITLEAEVDKGDLGVAEVKYLGGVPKGIRGIRFGPPKLGEAPPPGRSAVVTSVDGRQKTTHKVTDLQALYESDKGGTEKLSPLLMFKKTLKIDVAKIQKVVAPNPEAKEAAWQVALKDGSDETLTLIESPMLDGKPVVLKGLLGRIPAGYKLFPASTIGEIQFDAKDEEKPDK
jgi:hypothetical protein